MAQIPSLRQAYARLLIPQDTVRALIDHQGLNSLQMLKPMTPREVEDLCNNMRKPGGMIPNPDRHTAAGLVIAGAPAQVRNNGCQVAWQTEKTLKRLVYWLQHRDRISRPTTPTDVTHAGVLSAALQHLMDTEKDHVNPTEPTKLDMTDWPRVFEILDDSLSLITGYTGVPLSYLIRSDRRAPLDADDPGTNYSTLEAEMVARAPHFVLNPTNDGILLVPAFSTDNEALAVILTSLFQDSKHWVHFKDQCKKRDGRAAYLHARGHFLGTDMVNQQAQEAELRLQSLKYTGDRKRFTFEVFVTSHIHSHQQLEALVKHGYKGIDEGSKARYLNNGVLCALLAPARASILANPEKYGRNFNNCVTAYKTYAATVNPTHSSLNISDFGSRGDDGANHNRGGGSTGGSANRGNDRGGGGRGGGKGKAAGRGGKRGRGGGKPYTKKRPGSDEQKGKGGKVEFRYYDSREYAALSADQKQELKRLRAEASDLNSAKISSMETEIADLHRQIASTATAGGKKGSSNRTNGALKRAPGRLKKGDDSDSD
jgi:hypothetical protein